MDSMRSLIGMSTDLDSLRSIGLAVKGAVVHVRVAMHQPGRVAEMLFASSFRSSRSMSSASFTSSAPRRSRHLCRSK